MHSNDIVTATGILMSVHDPIKEERFNRRMRVERERETTWVDVLKNDKSWNRTAKYRCCECWCLASMISIFHSGNTKASLSSKPRLCPMYLFYFCLHKAKQQNTFIWRNMYIYVYTYLCTCTLFSIYSILYMKYTVTSRRKSCYRVIAGLIVDQFTTVTMQITNTNIRDIRGVLCLNCYTRLTWERTRNDNHCM